MVRLAVVVASLCAGGVLAQEPAFDAANRTLKESSFSRACDGFSAFLAQSPSSPLAREATVKRAYACLKVGKGSYLSELRTLAKGGERDFARAWAMWALAERGESGLDQALALLEQASQGSGRQADEARTLLVTGALNEMERQAWNRARVEVLAEQVLKVADQPGPKSKARYLRAVARLNDGSKVKEGEQELEALAEGSSDWADDAMFRLGERRENSGDFVAALAKYDGIVKRFSPSTSNVLDHARTKASEIRRPWLQASISTFELPGMKPQVSLNYRNVKGATYRLLKWSPKSLSGDAALRLPSDSKQLAGAEEVRTWKAELAEKAPHAIGIHSFELDVGTGAWVLVVEGGPQPAVAFALVTSHVTVVKTSRHEAVVWAAEAESGATIPNAEVLLFLRNLDDGKYAQRTGRTDAQGLARFDFEPGRYQVAAWTFAQNSWSCSLGHGPYWSRSQELLGYVLADRPLYKPGETAQLKLFVRSRDDGPSVPVAEETVTLKVRDAAGKEMLSTTLTTNRFGTAVTKVPIPAGATLGHWSVWVQDGKRSLQMASSGFQVESYKPPESVVTVTPPEQLPELGAPLKVKVSASFFFGGPVANATGKALVRVSGWSHVWKPWPQEDVQAAYGGYGQEEWGGRYRRHSYYRPQLATHTLPFKTGADGTAVVEVPAVPGGESYGGLSYAVEALVTDASRREVQGTGTINVGKEPLYVDARPARFLVKPGERVKVSLRAEDANGKALAPEVDLALVKVLQGNASGPVIARGQATLKAGVGEAALDADALGPVRIEVRKKGAAADSPALATSDLWLTSDVKPMVPPMAGFLVLIDRAPLASTDALRALVVAPNEGGHALVSMETDRVHSAQVVALNGRARFVELKLDPAMSPNAFLSVVRVEQAYLWQQQLQVLVKGQAHEAKVEVALVPSVVEPGSSLDAQVTAPAALGELEVAVTTVDEALYALSPERTDFLSFFGRRLRPHLVTTGSSFQLRSFRPRPSPAKQEAKSETRTADEKSLADRDDDPARRAPPKTAAKPAMGAPAPAAEAESLSGAGMASGRAKESKKAKDDAADDSGAMGNDGAGAEPVKVRQNFGTSAGFHAALGGKGGAPVKARLTLTDSLTSWRTTAYVVSTGAGLGVGRGTVRTEKPLMVRLQAPRFFTERDEVTLSAIVTSRMPQPAQVELTLSASGLKPLGPATQSVKVERGKDVRVETRFQVVEPGTALVKAVGKGGGKSDAMASFLPVVVHGSAQRVHVAGRLSDRFSFEVELPEKRTASQTRLELSLSPSLLAVMFDGLPYLAQYPYGCVEQTLSRFVPAAIAARTVKDLGLPSERVPKNLDDMVRAGLQRLVDFQHSDGGWGWWQTDPTNRWMSAYVVYGLSLGKSAGLDVSPSVLERGRGYLTSALGAALAEPETHAFMTYALAATGGAPKPALDSAFAVRTKLSPKGRALVALALLAAKDPRARIAVENLDDVVKAAKERADAAVGQANDSWSTSQAIEATAWVLLAMVEHDRHSPNVKPLTDFLVLRRNGGKWRTTRDTAFAIYALSALARQEQAATRSGSFVVTVNGKEVKRLRFTKGGLDLEPLVLGDAAFKPGKNLVEVKRDGGATGYYAASFDVFNQNDFIRGVGGDVVVTRTYTLLGTPSTERKEAPTEYGMPVDSGVRVRVDLEVKANKAVEYVMVEDLKPAGFEAVQLESGPKVCNYRCSHAELRPDRVALFLTELRVGTTTLSYELRAEVPGKFAALPARMEAMYAPELQATSDEMRFEVRDAPETGVAAQ